MLKLKKKQNSTISLHRCIWTAPTVARLCSFTNTIGFTNGTIISKFPHSRTFATSAFPFTVTDTRIGWYNWYFENVATNSTLCLAIGGLKLKCLSWYVISRTTYTTVAFAYELIQRIALALEGACTWIGGSCSWWSCTTCKEMLKAVMYLS